MEFTTDEYKRSIGRVFTTSDGNKYIQSKLKDSRVEIFVHDTVEFLNYCYITFLLYGL